VPTRTFSTQGGPVDLAGTLFPLRRGHRDPTWAIRGAEALLASRSAQGPATLHLRTEGVVVRAEAWGPGAAEVLDGAPDLVGAADTAEGFVPHDDVVADLWRRHRGIRMTRTPRIMPALIAAILEQKVTGLQAREGWRGLVSATSEHAPGPGGLWLPPDPARVAALPYFAFHRFGIERKRADLIRAVCSRAGRFEALSPLAPADAQARMQAHRGIGPWTAAEVARLAMGDADAVSVGDYHLPNLVSWMLAGEPRGTDERMLQLLEPYRGHRGRVQALLEAGGASAPKFGPRSEVPSIARI